MVWLKINPEKTAIFECEETIPNKNGTLLKLSLGHEYPNGSKSNN